MNKTILITGASSGIGAGCARKFASEGARVILNSRRADKLESLAQELKEKYGAECYVMPFDVCDRKAASAALEALPDGWKSIDVLINNAGLAVGVWDSLEDIEANREVDRVFTPEMPIEERNKYYAGWKKAVTRAMNWEEKE